MSETDVFALDEQEEPCFAPQPSAAPACFTPRIKQSSGSSNACRGAQSDGTPERAAEERQGPASDAAEEQDAGAASSSSGSSSGTAVGVECGTPPPEPNDGIEVARRVVPLLEYSEDICSVCLDEYTSQDPGAPTVCGHHYHLQCIMQWAQRSRECPLCFKSLQLEDEAMNSLLPFGEYVSPEQRRAEASSIEGWELERLLVRLAAVSQREHRHRSARHSSGSSSSTRHRRQGSRGETSAPQAIQDAAAAAGGGTAAAAALPWLLPGEASSRGADRTPSGTMPAAYPSSWPPAIGLEASGSGLSGSGSGSMHDDGHVVSPRSRSGSMSLKSRLASLKIKDKFEGVGRELKSLFSPAGGGGQARDGSGTSGSAR
ncbi:hypothetical protein D9Q98_002162 [Chlorella vulgaris]|uniref:RING-type E3 ubiquitin transferase n=1 Tax=Chlorella vulgaris TaxID=3077 RepID=A0A9D4TVR2_CHLVU|nr:hypothetical protein D9Q98_002162 [Chlorella vulgaris]